MLVLGTLGAAQRRLLKGRRGKALEEAEAPEPVPTSRATLVRPAAFGSDDEASAWLGELRADEERAEAELDWALRLLNRALHAQRAAAADPYPRDVGPGQALVIRVGYGSGEEAARGSFAEAWELPRERRRTKRSMEAPDERFAAIVGGRERVLACEELVLRARGDIDAGRPREAALQLRVALEALLAELPEASELGADRELIGKGANAALQGELPAGLAAELEAALGRMEHTLKRRRLGVG